MRGVNVILRELYLCYFYSVSLPLISIRQFLNKNLNEIKKTRNISKIQLKFRENGLVIAKKYTILKGRSKIFKWILQKMLTKISRKGTKILVFVYLFVAWKKFSWKRLNDTLETLVCILIWIYWILFFENQLIWFKIIHPMEVRS